MTLLEMKFLGGLDIRLTGQPALSLAHKPKALLAYLALETHTVHQRTKLATLFWPEVSEKQALQSLRQALYSLRRELGGAPFLLTTRHTISFNTESPYRLDVTEFRVSCQLHQYERAVELYRGDLLEGFFMDGCEELEAWLLLGRDRLHYQATGVLRALMRNHATRGEYEQAERYAQRYLDLEPYGEEGHRMMMRLFAVRGSIEAALTQFQRCRALLNAQLGVEPTAETQALYEQIRAMRFEHPGLLSNLSPIQLSADPESENIASRAPFHQFVTLPRRWQRMPLEQVWHCLTSEQQQLLTRMSLFGQRQMQPTALSAFQRYKLTHLFRLIDGDHDGYIRAPDLPRHASRLFSSPTLATTSLYHEQLFLDQLSWWQGLRQSANKNEYGVIVLEEWLTFWEQWNTMVAEEAFRGTREALHRVELAAGRGVDVLDRDADGRISPEEYGLWLHAWGTELDSPSAFYQMDVQKKGFLTRREVIALMKEFYLSNDPEAPGNQMFGPLLLK